MEKLHKPCKEYWWANLLYINNLVPWKGDEMCNHQSWYLSNDMQFYIVAPVFIMLLFSKPLLGKGWISTKAKVSFKTQINFISQFLCVVISNSANYRTRQSAAPRRKIFLLPTICCYIPSNLSADSQGRAFKRFKVHKCRHIN